MIEQTIELASKADEYTKIVRDQNLFAVNKSEKGIVDRCHNKYQLNLQHLLSKNDIRKHLQLQVQSYENLDRCGRSSKWRHTPQKKGSKRPARAIDLAAYQDVPSF